VRVLGARAGVRINLYLARCGLGARRAVERLVLEGRVAVDGETVRGLASRVAAGARVTVDGRAVRPRPRFRYYAYYKRRGVLTTSRDPFRRRTVAGELPRRLRTLKPVGRLDLDTEGLLLLTDDGAFAQRVAHPSFGVPKRYEVEVRGEVTAEAVAALERGISLEDGHLGKVKVARVKTAPGSSRVTVVTCYGRKRMLRQMFAALGFEITSLRRVAVGTVTLEGLRPGQWRALTVEEVAALRRDGR